MNFIALDIETAPIGDAPQEYALQPWRYQEGTATPTCISVGQNGGGAILVTKPEQYRALLKKLAGKTVWTHNGVFDTAWLIAMGFYEEVNAINWGDTMILWKWLDNSQLCERRPAWSLGAMVKRFFKDEPWAKAFIKMKAQEVAAGENDAYWEQRAKLDAVATAKCAVMIWNELDAKRRKSAMITMSGIVPVANSWMLGVPIDFSMIEGLIPQVTAEMEEIEFRLGVHNFQGTSSPPAWTPSKILRSPKQLGNLLFNIWKIVPKNFSEKTGAPSTDKAALTYIADSNDNATLILRWRMLNTQLTKYIQAPLKARAYLDSDTVHPAPRLFSTVTGRMTYTSKTAKKFQTGVALHQWPRNKVYRALIKPRPGYKHVEWDASGQESRLMADASGDMSMRQVFIDKKDFHSVTGANLAGMSYEDFIKGKARGNTAITGEHGLRYQGKFCIAKGQLVDTDRGSVAIEDVTLFDKVWDGVQYVAHEGVVCLGRKKVICRDGIIGTPDHKVLTQKGWKELQEVSDNEICRRDPPIKESSIRPLDTQFFNSSERSDPETSGGMYARAHLGAASDKDLEESEALVYDIINAGPRNRFTIQGRIVSNCNLSNNFRIGLKKLRVQARVQYGMDVDFGKAKSWQDTFFRSFPDVKKYWKRAINTGKSLGYAETIGGRRFKLQFWSADNRWSTESSAIMMPIQGSGADMKDLAIQEMHKKFPQFIFWFDLHDGLHYQVPNDTPDKDLIKAREMLNRLNYEKWWGYTPSIPLTWDVSVGPRWSGLEEL